MSSGNQSSNRMETMKKTASDTASQVKTAVSESAGKLQEMGTGAMEYARDHLSEAGSMAGEYAEQGRVKAMEYTHALEREIRNRPLVALLAAAGVGCLLGMLLLPSNDNSRRRY